VLAVRLRCSSARPGPKAERSNERKSLIFMIFPDNFTWSYSHALRKPLSRAFIFNNPEGGSRAAESPQRDATATREMWTLNLKP
jgi:hypothetical protein